jgi:hypothetical protein
VEAATVAGANRTGSPLETIVSSAADPSARSIYDEGSVGDLRILGRDVGHDPICCGWAQSSDSRR